MTHATIYTLNLTFPGYYELAVERHTALSDKCEIQVMQGPHCVHDCPVAPPFAVQLHCNAGDDVAVLSSTGEFVDIVLARCRC